MKTSHRARLGPPAALLGLLTALLLTAAPAAAHGGEGRSEITSITRSGGEVTVVARLTYVEDGHGVPDATVTVVVDDSTPVPMEPGAEEGDYTATVAAAEGATIRVTSVEPATTVEVVAPSAEATTTTAASSTTAAETTTTEAPEDGDEGQAAATAPTPVPDEDADSDDGISPIVIGAVVAVLAAAGVMAAILLWKRPDGTTDLDGPGPPR